MAKSDYPRINADRNAVGSRQGVFTRQRDTLEQAFSQRLPNEHIMSRRTNLPKNQVTGSASGSTSNSGVLLIQNNTTNYFFDQNAANMPSRTLNKKRGSDSRHDSQENDEENNAYKTAEPNS